MAVGGNGCGSDNGREGNERGEASEDGNDNASRRSPGPVVGEIGMFCETNRGRA